MALTRYSRKGDSTMMQALRQWATVPRLLALQALATLSAALSIGSVFACCDDSGTACPVDYSTCNPQYSVFSCDSNAGCTTDCCVVTYFTCPNNTYCYHRGFAYDTNCNHGAGCL
jgi:hypothetical protein